MAHTCNATGNPHTVTQLSAQGPGVWSVLGLSTHHLAALVFALQGNMAGEVHAPPKDGDEENAGLADELEGPVDVEQSVYVQLALVVRHVHRRLVRGWEVLSALDDRPAIAGQTLRTSNASQEARRCHTMRQVMGGRLRRNLRTRECYCVHVDEDISVFLKKNHSVLVKEGGAYVGPDVICFVVGPPPELVEEKHEGVHDDHGHEDGDHDDECREPEEECPYDMDEWLLRGSLLRRHCMAGREGERASVVELQESTEL